jgi:cobaltochelatase CobS
VLEQPNEVERQLEGLTHCQFNDLVRMANVRDWKGHRKNILLKGPMGGGKTTAGEKLAELLGLHFGYIGQTNMPHIVVGSKRPLDDQYNHTPFTRIFRDGGVIMLEEMDAWNPNASLVLNPPLANGLLILEDGTEIKRHPDCIIIACANTWGTGATTEYVGRNKLDAAFLDRFAFKVMWSYDEELERAAANNEEVVDAVQRARFNADYNGIKVSISPRCSIDIADMVRGGFTIYEAMKMNFLASVDSNTESKLLDGVDL